MATQEHRDEVERLVNMMATSGQDTLIAEALSEGRESVEEVSEQLGRIWEVDAETLAEAIRKVLRLDA